MQQAVLLRRKHDMGTHCYTISQVHQREAAQDIVRSFGMIRIVLREEAELQR